jgi:hypothetical protein
MLRLFLDIFRQLYSGHAKNEKKSVVLGIPLRLLLSYRTVEPRNGSWAQKRHVRYWCAW